MGAQSYSYLLEAFTDAKERAELLDLGHRLALEPDAPEWALLALGEFNVRRLAGVANHLETAASGLVDGLVKNAQRVAEELAVNAGAAATLVREGTHEATKEALEASLPTFLSRVGDNLSKSVEKAITSLEEAQKAQLETVARLEGSFERGRWQRRIAMLFVALSIGILFGWTFSARTFSGAVHSEVCADLGRRSVQIADYLRAKGFVPAADAVSGGIRSSVFGDCR